MKQAQLQISQSIFIVIFLLLLIVFGIVFYSGAQESSVKRKQSKFAELESIEKAQISSSLGELRCSMTGTEQTSCFEVERIQAFINLTEEHPRLTQQYYFSKLGDTQIVIEQVYPTEEQWLVYNNTLSDSVRQSGLPVIIPVSLYSSARQTYGYGVMYVTTFQEVRS